MGKWDQGGSKGIKGDQSKEFGMVELSQECQCVHFIIQKYRNIFLYLKIESHDTGNGFLLTPTGSFFVGNALLHLIIILKPAYQGYFNRIKNASLSRYFQKGSKGIKGGLWANGQMGKWDQRGSKGIKGDQRGSNTYMRQFSGRQNKMFGIGKKIKMAWWDMMSKRRKTLPPNTNTKHLEYENENENKYL